MRFTRDRAEGHRTRCKALDDGLRRFDFIKRYGFTTIFFRALDAEEITVRGLHRIQRVAWSIADLREEDTPSRASVDQALSLHVSERL